MNGRPTMRECAGYLRAAGRPDLARSLSLLSPIRVAAIACILAAIPAAGCGDGRGQRGRAVEGIVLEENGDPAHAAIGRRAGSSRTYVASASGRLRVGGLPSGTSLIRIGDSVRHPGFLFPASAPGRGVFRLDRAVFLPDLAAGDSTPLFPIPGADTILAPPSLPGLRIVIADGTAVGLPPGVPDGVAVVAVATDRLPIALPQGRDTRAAYAVEPAGATFAPPATIAFPNADGLPPGAAAEMWRVDPLSGSWEMVGILTVDSSGTTLTGGTLDEATLVAAFPTATFPTGEVTGRIASPAGGGVEGYPVLLPGSVGAVSAVDGTFLVTGVPLGAGPIRVHAVSHSGVATEVAQAGPVAPAGSTTDVGDIPVLGSARDAVAPAFTSNPAADATGVDENITIVLSFSEPMDTIRTSMDLASVGGTTAGTELLSADGRKMTFEPDQPLLNLVKYYIILDEDSADLSGNRVPENDRVVSFTTRATPSPPPVTVSVIGLKPAEGRVGDTVDVIGRNFPGGSAVTVGGTAAQVLFEGPQRIRFRIPAGPVAGNHPVAVSGVGSPALTVLPTLDAIDLPYGDPGGGYPVILAGRALGTAPSVRFHGAPPILSTTHIAFGITIDPATPGNLILATGGGAFRSVNGAGGWTAASTGITETITRSAAFDPLDPSRVYLGSFGGGVMRSTDGGITWSPSTAGLGAPRVLVVAPSRSTAGIVLAGTARGLYQSTDFGATWAASDTGLADKTVLSLAQDPASPLLWYAGTTGGIYRSTDGGIRWDRTGVEAGHATVPAIAVEPGAGATIYAGTLAGRIFRSTDSGVAWADSSIGLPGAPVSSLAPDPVTTSIVYAGTLGAAIYKSSDSGLSWSPAGTGLTEPHVLAVAVDPATPATIYAAAEGTLVFKSGDSGATWATSAGGASYTEPRIVAIPDRGVPTGPVVVEVGGHRSNPRVFLSRRWPDLTGPAVLSVDPPDGATGVAVDTPVRIVLSEPVSAASGLTLTDPGMTPVAGSLTVTVRGERSEITFQPAAPLLGGTTYTVTVSGAPPATDPVTDISGNPLDQDPILPADQDFVSTFSTQ